MDKKISHAVDAAMEEVSNERERERTRLIETNQNTFKWSRENVTKKSEEVFFFFQYIIK